MNLSWWNITEIYHEMWINSLYLWLVICSKNPCNRHLLYRWGNCRWLALGHRACGWQGEDKILSSCHNPFDILSYSARNSENTDNWHEFLGSVSYFHYSPVPGLTWAPKHRGEWIGIPLAPNMWCSSNNIQFSKHSLGVQKANLLLIQNLGSSYRFSRLRAQNCPQLRCQPHGLESLMIWQSG